MTAVGIGRVKTLRRREELDVSEGGGREVSRARLTASRRSQTRRLPPGGRCSRLGRQASENPSQEPTSERGRFGSTILVHDGTAATERAIRSGLQVPIDIVDVGGDVGIIGESLHHGRAGLAAKENGGAEGIAW